jgi:hypothetical protein
MSSGMGLACGMDHTLERECATFFKSNWGKDSARVVFHINAEPGKPVTLTRYLTYHTSRSDNTDELRDRAERSLGRVVGYGFGHLLADQRAYLDDFWKRRDIHLHAAGSVRRARYSRGAPSTARRRRRITPRARPSITSTPPFCLHEADLEPCVVYRDQHGVLWVRPLAEFQQRFVLVPKND